MSGLNFFSLYFPNFIILVLSPAPFYFVFVSFFFYLITDFELELYGIFGP